MLCYIVNSSASGFASDPASSTTEALILERVDAIQHFVRMINQHPQSSRTARNTTSKLQRYPARLKKPARRASVHFCGGSLPWSHVLSVIQLTPSFVAVWRSESLVSLVYRVNAWRTSSVLIAGVKLSERVESTRLNSLVRIPDDFHPAHQ